ncbi:winged helix-turn-helix domain-containing protein [Chloroflexota bacterium]
MKSLPSPTLIISKKHAKRYLLAHQQLWPPRQLKGKAGVLDFATHVGCIQFDPINVVGRNPDLVLQSRLKDYRPALLEELLYKDRELLDGFDKVQSIYATSDWACFTRRRNSAIERYSDPSNPPVAIAPEVIEEIRVKGPLSSIDIKNADTIDWSWGQNTRLARASLEVLYAIGDVGVHHKVNTRRVFDLTERLIPPAILHARDPNQTDEDYQDWHVMRRVAGLGLANPSAAQYWEGILSVNGETRRSVLGRLVENGKLASIAIEDLPKRTFFIRICDLPTLKNVQSKRAPKARAAILAALDNLMWDRSLMQWVFDFDYIWEVYKPADKRRYGYYVLPVLYGERFVARFEPVYDKKTRQLTIVNWWWEAEIRLDERMEVELTGCLRQFMDYLDVSRLVIGDKVKRDKNLYWLRELERS